MDMLDVLLSPERRAKAVKEQADLRERHGHRVVTSPAHVTFFWGRNLELRVLGELEPGEHSERQQWLRNQLIEALMAQARYQEAASISQNPEQVRELSKRAWAVSHLNAKQCVCPDTIRYHDPTNAKGRIESSLRDLQRVSNGTQVITIKECLHCHTISAYA